MSIEMQKQIRENSKDISAYFTDLRKWTDDIRQEEKNRTFAKNAPASAPPPIRGAVSIEKKHKVEEKPKEEEKPPKEKAKYARDKTKMNDYYKAWDNFDVDEEEKKLEKEVCGDNFSTSTPANSVDVVPTMDLAQQKRTTEARPNMKVALRTSVRATTDEEYASAKKEEANKLFAQSRIREARDAYTQALTYLKSVSELRSTILTNRALCHLKLNDFADTIKDSTEALHGNPGIVKAHFRKAIAHAKLKQWKLAQEHLMSVVSLDPKDTKAASELASVNRTIKEETNRRREHARKLMTFKRPFTMPLRRLQIEEISGKREKEESIQEAPEVVGAATAEAIAPAPISIVTKSADMAKKPYVPRCLRSTPSSSTTAPSSAPMTTNPAPNHSLTSEATMTTAGTAATAGAAECKSSPVFKPPTRSRPAPPMRNFYDFEHRWRSLKDSEKRWELLSSIDLAKLCRESFETELLVEILEVCEGRQYAHKVLRPLSKVKRWDITLMGLTRDERRKFDDLCAVES